jgi:fibronectin type 3 domain-containing protein
MNSVKIERKKLLDIVTENSSKHVEQYLEAIEDYKVAALKIAKENLKTAKTGDMQRLKTTRSLPSAPVSYEHNYARAIRMLELSAEDIIELEESVFNQLVLDEWGWKQQFMSLAATYKSF